MPIKKILAGVGSAIGMSLLTLSVAFAATTIL